MKNKEEQLLVVDINYILPQFKEKTIEELKEQFEAEYECKVFFIDSSRVNTQGNLNTHLPTYYTK